MEFCDRYLMNDFCSRYSDIIVTPGLVSGHSQYKLLNNTVCRRSADRQALEQRKKVCPLSVLSKRENNSTLSSELKGA